MCPDFSVVTIMKMLKITSGVSILLSLLISVGCTDSTGTDVNNQSNYEQNSTSFTVDTQLPTSTHEKTDSTHAYPYREGDAIPALAYIEHDEVYNPESVIPPQC